MIFCAEIGGRPAAVRDWRWGGASDMSGDLTLLDVMTTRGVDARRPTPHMISLAC
jgi:hypothetical protein